MIAGNIVDLDYQREMLVNAQDLSIDAGTVDSDQMIGIAVNTFDNHIQVSVDGQMVTPNGGPSVQPTADSVTVNAEGVTVDFDGQVQNPGTTPSGDPAPMTVVR